MHKNHTTYYVKDVKPIEFCGEVKMYQLDLNGAYSIPYKIAPTEGEHDYQKCDGCQNTRERIREFMENKFSSFPNCCPAHRNLVNVKEYDRKHFEGIAEMVADKVIFANQHITNHIESDDWYKECTDYIEYAVDSFGNLPNDCGAALYLGDFLHYLKDLNTTKDDKFPERRKALIEFMDRYFDPPEKATDFNVLANTYQTWMKIFPFEISYFNGLKEKFERMLPIMNGQVEHNPYLGISKVKMHTKNSLFEALLRLTDNLLKKLNGLTFFEQGKLDDPEKVKLEIVIKQRRLKLEQGYHSKSQNEDERYRKMIKAWLKDEKAFLKEVTPLLKSIEQRDTTSAEVREKKNPEGNKAKLLFKNQDALIEVHGVLKGYFVDKEEDLMSIFKGEYDQEEKLLFPDRGNKFVEVFRRLQYNHIITNNYTEIRDWICDHFCFKESKGGKEKVKPFNSSSVYDILRGKDGAIPAKKSRILMDLEWLPFKTKEQLKRESEEN